jgi:hypothetical protein
MEENARVINNHPHMVRERKTVEAMIGLYCRKHHAPEGMLCAECRELLHYAHLRLENCPFQEHKNTCEKCPVHCYQPKMRERIRTVMRYAGPRMLFRRPLLALLHLWDRVRGQPTRP